LALSADHLHGAQRQSSSSWRSAPIIFIMALSANHLHGAQRHHFFMALSAIIS
jgi:hypothetical protein